MEDEDRLAKRRLVLETLAAHLVEASSSTEFDDLRDIRVALEEGGKLVAEELAGGKTNYSYKVYVEDSPTSSAAKPVYAKLNLQHALWCPDKSVRLDLERAQNELRIMSRFRKRMGDQAPVVTPYFCIALKEGKEEDEVEDMNLIVTQWSHDANEQFANQFIDGWVDRRLFPQLGRAFATLNTMDFDVTFNVKTKEFVSSLLIGMHLQVFPTYFENAESGQDDKCIAFAKELGLEVLMEIAAAMIENYNKADILCHQDSHVFNILVEPKPTTDKLQPFGDKGSVVVCDWENATPGPTGRDLGLFQGFPIAAAMAHTLLGNQDVGVEFLDCLFLFFDSYNEIMVENGKDENYLRDAFANSLGWAGQFLFLGYYVARIHVDYLPLDDIPEKDQTLMFGSIGYIGLRFYTVAFTDMYKDLSLNELRDLYRELVAGEIEFLAANRTQRLGSARRHSALRESGRRVSDPSVYEEMARRISDTVKDMTLEDNEAL